MIEDLCNFAKVSVFKRACLGVLSWSLGVEERKQVRDAFLQIDKEHRKRRISWRRRGGNARFRAFSRCFGRFLGPLEDRSGTITINEFKQAVEQNLEIDDATLEKAFKAPSRWGFGAVLGRFALLSGAFSVVFGPLSPYFG